MKLETIIEKQNEGMQILRQLLGTTRGVGGRDMLEDMLPDPLDQVDQFNALCDKLSDEDFKEKMVNYCGALCGADVGDSARRIIVKVGTNNLWSSYGLKEDEAKQLLKALLAVELLKVYKSSVCFTFKIVAICMIQCTYCRYQHGWHPYQISVASKFTYFS